MPSKHPTKRLTGRREKDVATMIKRATSQPGVAEVLALHRKYREKLSEVEGRLRQRRLTTISTSDSTA
jgi:hypothetical protein